MARRPGGHGSIDIAGQTYTVSSGLVRTVRLEDEWYDDVRAPSELIANLKESRADIFTFWQRLPDSRPRFHFHTEWETVAALPISTFDAWWDKHITSRTRNLIRKAEKSGVEVREACYDDEFVRGMTAVFNETPVRQGKRFWHYGKNFETVKREFSRFLFREDLIGAYYHDELIGFVMLANAGRYGVTAQIISKIAHRDKGTNNALIAKAVQVCEKKALPYLVYLHWGNDSLTEFKRRCGFEPVQLPRYYVPLTPRGTLAIKAGLHRGWKHALPVRVRDGLKLVRGHWLRLTGS